MRPKIKLGRFVYMRESSRTNASLSYRTSASFPTSSSLASHSFWPSLSLCEGKPLWQSLFMEIFPLSSFDKGNRLLFGAAMQTLSDEIKPGKPNRRLRVVKWVGTVPVVAVCTMCARQFTVPTTNLLRTADTHKTLHMKFDRHECSRKWLDIRSLFRVRVRCVPMREGWIAPSRVQRGTELIEQPNELRRVCFCDDLFCNGNPVFALCSHRNSPVLGVFRLRCRLKPT